MINVYTYLILAVIEVGRFLVGQLEYVIAGVLTASAIVAVINFREQAKKDKEVKDNESL